MNDVEIVGCYGKLILIAYFLNISISIWYQSLWLKIVVMIGKLRNYKFELKDLKKESYDLEDVNKDMRKTFGEEKNKGMKDLILNLYS